MLAKINLSSNSDNTEQNSFTGDIQQFYTFLEERLGSKKLKQIRDIISRYNDDDSGDPTQESNFKKEIEEVMDEQSRMSYMPLVHALINMEEMVK